MAEEQQKHSSNYGICRTCGKFVPANLLETGGCCSLACAAAYGQCITCGRHVPREALHGDHFCSPQCSVQYKFLKTLGPRPVVITSDQSTNDPDDILI